MASYKRSILLVPFFFSYFFVTESARTISPHSGISAEISGSHERETRGSVLENRKILVTPVSGQKLSKKNGKEGVDGERGKKIKLFEKKETIMGFKVLSQKTKPGAFKTENEKKIEGFEKFRRSLSDSSQILTKDKPNDGLPSLYNAGQAVQLVQSGPYSWQPEGGKYLMMHCTYGRISNRIACFQNALSFASLLNRTLLVIMDPINIYHHFDRHIALDIKHIRLCYGENSVMSTQEYRIKYGKDVVIDQVLCMNEKGCPIKDFSAPIEKYLSWKNITFDTSIFKPQISSVNARSLTFDQVCEHFGNLSGRVLYMGEFYFNVARSKSFLSFPSKRLEKCDSNLAVQPDHAIFETAKLFVKEKFKEKNFMAIHLRRGDFAVWCHEKDIGCYMPIEKISNCLKEKLQAFNISEVFLATNTNAQELAYIEKDFNSEGMKVRIVLLENGGGDLKWFKPLTDQKLKYDGLVRAELDKVISMYSSVFVGTRKSTFTEDIERLRYGFGTGNSKDSYLCELPTLN